MTRSKDTWVTARPIISTVTKRVDTMKSIILAGALAMLLGGCSIFHAVNAPPPVDYKKISTGTTRVDTIALLGTPKWTQKKGDQELDYFEFTDGYHGLTKARILIYAGGDLFTAGLSEILFYPLEVNLLDGKSCRATVHYGSDDRVTSYEVLSKKGAPLWVGGTPVAAAPAKAKLANSDQGSAGAVR